MNGILRGNKMEGKQKKQKRKTEQNCYVGCLILKIQMFFMVVPLVEETCFCFFVSLSSREVNIWY